MAKKIKVCVMYEFTDEPWGGVNSFMKAFAKNLKKRHELEVTSYDQADVIIISAASIGMVQKVSKYQMRNIVSGRKLNSSLGRFFVWKRKKFIHRLDGLGRLYGRKDDMDDKQLVVTNFADYTVFQSVFCKESFSSVGVRPSCHSIIGNGVDEEVFTLKKDSSLKDPVRMVSSSWSPNLMKGQEIVSRFSELDGVEMSFIGRWPEDIDKGKVKLCGVMKQKDISKELKKHDVFLHAATNDPCPNVVYEALATGLPVIYNTTGGTPEICGHGKYGTPLLEDLEETLQNMRSNYETYVSNIKKDYRNFTISYVADRYFEIIKEVVSSDI